MFRIYKKLNISSVEALHERLENGEIEQKLGRRIAQYVCQGITEDHAVLLYRADELRTSIEEFLVHKCGVRRAEVAGDYRRRVETIDEMVFSHRDGRPGLGGLKTRAVWWPCADNRPFPLNCAS